MNEAKKACLYIADVSILDMIEFQEGEKYYDRLWNSVKRFKSDPLMVCDGFLD